MKRWLMYIFFALICCQCNMGQSSMNEELLNKVIVQDTVYKKDSSELFLILEKRMREHESSFYSKEYYDSTPLILDTILYNEKENKIALFIVTKNSTSRQLNPNKSNDYYYDAFCYIGKIDTTTDTWDIKWFNVFNLINYYDLREIRERIRFKYFNELATVNDTNGNPFYKYNLNDRRFWSSKAWKKYFE